MNLLILLAATVFLQVTEPVAALQCDLTTSGNAHAVPALVIKQLSSNRLPNGKLRIVVHGLNTNTFSGTFATVDAKVTAIEGVVAANPDGTQSSATVKKVSKTTGLKIQ